MAEITASDRAYCKIILHAAKYPHCSVNGVLLVEKHRNKEAKGLKIVDAIPLFHLTLTLAPMMEIALTQIDGYCKLKGLTIGGYYQANEHYQRVRPNAIACKIADRIHDHHSDACLIMVENESLSMECEREAIKVYTNQDGKWKPKEQRHIVDSECLAKTSSLLQSKAYQELVDFDAHLADISLDWQNTRINDMVDHST